MLFSYQLADEQGKITDGTIDASDIKDARNKLSLRSGNIIKLEPAVREKVVAKKAKAKSHGITFGRVKLMEKVMLAKHLSVMIKSGMAIDDAIEVLLDNASPLMAKRLDGILESVRKGNSLATALKSYPRDFDALFHNMVAVGEAGGTLAKNLELLSVQQNKTHQLKLKLRAASMYPTMVLIAITGLVVVVSIFVLPKLVGFFTTLKIDLPLPTKILIAVANVFSSYWMWIVGAGVVLVALLKILSRLPHTRIIIHYIILKLPLIGHISRDMNLALFCRTLASLLSSGITIDRSLQIVADTLTNDAYKKKFNQVYHNILKGSSLADSLNDKKYFPSIVARMTRVGEHSGNLSEVLDYLADFYEQEVDNTTKNLSNVLEPALLVLIGLVVGFVAISIINPIYELTSKVA